MMTGDCGSTCPAIDGFYSYDLNVGGNAVLLAAFAILSVVVPYLGIISCTPLFSVTLTTGLLAEVLGFVGRILLHSARDDQAFFFLCLLGTVLGPTFISAAIFIILTHVLGIYGDLISPFKSLVTGFVFFGLITVALVIQLVGIVFIAFESSNVSRTSGARIAAAGSSIQAVFLLACSALHFCFTLGLRTRRASIDTRHCQVYTSSRFWRLVMGMEVAVALLVAYSIYRIVELAGGVSGPLFQNQPAFMIVGGTVPLLSGAILTIFHPGPIFGDAWAGTTPGGIRREGQPPSIQHFNGHAVHHRYDPDIRTKNSPTSPRGLRSSASPPELPAGSPGLPASPKPASKPSSPLFIRTSLIPSLEHTAAGRSELKSIIQPAKEMVSSDGLW